MNTTAQPTTLTGPQLSKSQPAPDQESQEISGLPKPTRDMINLMLDDELPYKVIIDELAETAAGITPKSLTDWLQKGYKDHLARRDQIDEAKAEAEFAIDLLRELGGIDPTM